MMNVGPAFWYAAPVGHDALYSYRRIMLHCDGADGSTSLTDSSSDGRSVTALSGDAISTTWSKFGSGSLASRAQVGSTPALTISGDFCFECFGKLAASGTNCAIITLKPPGSSDGWELYRRFASGGALSLWSGASNVIISSTAAISVGPAYHIAWSREGLVHRIFLDGSLAGSFSETGSPSSIQCDSIMVGCYATTGEESWSGWLDEIALHVGVPIYTASFSPPSAAYR